MQGEPPVVKLPGHPAKAGYLIAWRQKSDRSWEAQVQYVMDVPGGYRAHLEKPYTSWFQAHEVEPVEGEDYRRVPRIRSGS
ncbi:hypothetical protein SAMN05421811_103217 [Nonomuraea wenchangensis]|uniref:Uncharacterized protein n=1 Tax=Nonomuraea wenchangensis TaxID=568860 RepID=A0A1I0EW74_9ACTN|nr:hypothetical protein SAMN05421811_103217 [Nonomuraea wenchangensis]